MTEKIIHAEVISLTESNERREMVHAQLSDCPYISWEFLDAVDGRKLMSDPPEYSRKRAKRLMGWTLTDGEIGCFLSHRLAWRKCLLKDTMILILEDDFLIKPILPAALEFAVDNISAWDVLRLQAIHDHGSRAIITQNGDFAMVQNIGDPFGCTAYLVKPAAANILLKQSEQFYEPVDNYLENEEMHGLRMVAVKPYPVDITHLDSTITGRESRSSVRGFQQFKRSFFRMLNRVATGEKKP